METSPPLVTDLADVPATELMRLYARQDVSPVEATRAVLDRIEACDPVVNAFRFVDAERALEAAGESEARWMAGTATGLLDGIPATLKDTQLAAGWSTLAGSLTIDADQPWEEDSPIAARMREQGAVLLGKTNTPEFGWKGVTDSPLTGITRNAWDPEMTPGGSSGGAATAAALGMGALHAGTDAGGSIRIPASFSGVFGIKPSFGRVPAYPTSVFASMSHTGPITRTVSDAALMLSVIAEPDLRDPHALPPDGRDYRVGLEDGVRGLRIAYSETLGYVEVDPEIAALVDAAVDVFVELGALVEAVDPGFPAPRDILETHWHAFAAALFEGIDPQRRNAMDPGLARFARDGMDLPARDLVAAARRRADLIRHMNRFHDQYDLLLTPTLPIPAFAAGTDVADPAAQEYWYDWTPFSYPFNLTGQPACTVPCGLTEAGLPAGLQIVCARHADWMVLLAARAFEAARPFELPNSNLGAR